MTKKIVDTGKIKRRLSPDDVARSLGAEPYPCIDEDKRIISEEDNYLIYDLLLDIHQILAKYGKAAWAELDDVGDLMDYHWLALGSEKIAQYKEISTGWRMKIDVKKT